MQQSQINLHVYVHAFEYTMYSKKLAKMSIASTVQELSGKIQLIVSPTRSR